MSNATSTSVDIFGCADEQKLSTRLPVDPFRSLHVHFGMLLGVDDFETVDAYHRGKMWLHNAWLHGAGVLWGLAVTLDRETEAIRVSAGLALDAMGREIYLASDACLDVGRWFAENRHRSEVAAAVTETEDDGQRLDAHVVIAFRGCLDRQVPALNEPCDASGATTAYSRVVETAELLLVPGPAPQWRAPSGSLPYHRLRLLFALEDPVEDENGITPDDQAVLDQRSAILALPTAEQPAAYLEAFRKLASDDTMAMTPAVSAPGEPYTLFPCVDPAPVLLADLPGLVLVADNDGWRLSDDSDGVVDNSVRPVHVATATIQELLSGPLCRCLPASPGPAAQGPRIDPDSVVLDEGQITFTIAVGSLLERSITPAAFSVSSFDPDNGWQMVEIDEERGIHYDSETNNVSLPLATIPGGNLIRLIVKGTGPTPLLGPDNVPLVGAVDGPPGTAFNGNDFVYMKNI